MDIKGILEKLRRLDDIDASSYQAGVLADENLNWALGEIAAKMEEARRGEGERILNYLKGLLKSTPKASLAATIGLIESNEESRSLRTQPITDKVFSVKDLEKLLEEAESKGFDDCLNLIIGADDNALTRKIKTKIEEAKKQLIAKVNRYFETEPWMTQEDWEALKSTEEGGRK